MRQGKKSFWQNTKTQNKAFVKWFICAETLVFRRRGKKKSIVAGIKPDRLGQS